MASQQTIIPVDDKTLRRLQPGDELRVNMAVQGSSKTITNVYRVQTVDRINGIAGCVWLSQQEFRVN